MSHRISLEEANEKYERELEIRELQKQGKVHKSKRRDRRTSRIKKEKNWLDYIKRRGGLFKPKKEKTDIDKVL